MLFYIYFIHYVGRPELSGPRFSFLRTSLVVGTSGSVVVASKFSGAVETCVSAGDVVSVCPTVAHWIEGFLPGLVVERFSFAWFLDDVLGSSVSE